MERLPHGYTNRTRLLPDGCIEKVYDGPRRWDNARRELASLTALAGRLCVPAVVDHDPSRPATILRALPGRHGQDLLTEQHAVPVLRLVGETLARLQAIAPDSVPGLAGAGSVLVHGDFGPQNMLFDLAAGACGIIDWESAHVGSPIEDLAWAEWIVRAHHPDAVDALDTLFEGAGQRPPWARRREAMLQQQREILAYCESAGMERSAADWRDRLRATEAWVE